MTEPRPLTSAEAIALIGATASGPDVTVRRLVDPDDLRPDPGVGHPTDAAAMPDGVVVLTRLDATAWAICRQAGVVAVVTTPAAAAMGSTDTASALALWLVGDPKLALARLSRRLDPRPPAADPGVHPSAVVDPTARLGARVAIGPHAVVGAGADIGDDVVVGPGCVVGAGSRIGSDSTLYARAVVSDGVTIGARCRLQTGCVVGSDGFGFAFGPRGAERIHHLGTVVLGDDVDVGANACIDRATLGATRIGDRSKLDNLVQVAHNVRLGRDVVMAGQAGVAGSTTVGDRVVIGGAAAITDHVEIGDDVRIAGGAGITKSVPAGQTWGGYPAQPAARWARERYLIGRLEAIWAAVSGRDPKGRA